MSASTDPFAILREPVSSLLSRLGVRYRVVPKGAVTWYNMEKCPACGHENYQCGVAENTGPGGKLYHGVKCWHVADSGLGSDTPEYEDFLFRIGVLTAADVATVKSQNGRFPKRLCREGGRGGGAVCPNPSATNGSEEGLRPLNVEFLAVLKKRLRHHPGALSYLMEVRGLTTATVERFNLGLSTPYMMKSGEVRENALVYPLFGSNGRLFNKYGYYNVPGVTKNPVNGNGWMSGPVRTYYAGSAAPKAGRSVFVCEGAKDVWRLWQALQGTSVGNHLVLITSTHGSAFPDGWREPEFWSGWDNVYFGYDNDDVGESVARKIAEFVARDVRRVLVPKWYGKDWTDFWQSGGTVGEFVDLLDESDFLSAEVRPDGEPDLGPGRYAYAPMDINGAYHHGHLYYTAQTLKRDVEMGRNEAGEDVVEILERLETVVIRSDQTVHTATLVKAPKGTKFDERVLRLSDGTLVDREPRPNKYGTWSWASISAYLQEKSKTRHLSEIISDVLTFLRASVWLPYEEDYALLALAVPVTYLQSVFNSVPLLFLNGPAGSGKSQMGRAMARVCANAYVCGQSSAASIARFIDESRGFVVLDDLEMIGNRSGEFNDLAQALKQSYNKETAVKLWTDVKTMRTEKLNFFGVKMINNTSGVDSILGSRMIRIQTRKIPDGLKKDFADLKPTESSKLEALRNELHTWAFEHVADVHAEYERLYPKRTDRADEIAAPLQVFASLAADPGLKSQLEVALTRQKHRGLDADDPLQVMREALKNLIAQGYNLISITHLVLEMRSLLGENYGKAYTNEIPEWARPEWVGRMLRTHDLIDTAPGGAQRIRLYGSNLRFYPINPSYVDEVLEFLAQQGTVIQPGTREPTSFCGGCEACPYSQCNCEIMPKRLSYEGRDTRR